MSTQHTSQPSFVIAASVAAELHHAMNVARGVSLTAKNARAIAARAGQESVGFKAITNFIDELAHSMISQANSINQIAIGISRTAVMQLRARDAQQRFVRVAQRSATQHDRSELSSVDASSLPHYIESIAPSRQRIDLQVKDLSEKLEKVLCQLATELAETQRQIRAADIIATTSKVEASRAGAFREPLNAIAENIQLSADEIKKHLLAAQQMMREFKEM